MKKIINPSSLEEHLSKTKKTAVLFVLSHCPFCNAFKPSFETFSGECKKDCDFLEIVLDDYDNPLWEKYKIDVVPTIILFDKGRIIERCDGIGGVGLKKEDLKKIDSLL